ncbi:MAG: hypothetical protein GF313_11500 [Caldithrix sp.]|nr:hypothetical protein [Caldithrix sp.]
MHTGKNLQNKILIVLIPLILISALAAAYLDYIMTRERTIEQTQKNSVAHSKLIHTYLNQVLTDSSKEIKDNAYWQSLLVDLSGKLPQNENVLRILKINNTMSQIMASSTNENADFDLWMEMRQVAEEGGFATRMHVSDNTNYFAVLSRLDGHKILMVDQKIKGSLTDWFSYLSIPGILAIVFIIIAGGSIFGQRVRLQKRLQDHITNLTKIIQNKTVLKPEETYGYLEELDKPISKLETHIHEIKKSDNDRDKIQNQIKELLRVVNAAAEGDFTVSADVSADILGALGDSFNLMVSDLSELIKDTKNAAELVADSTREIIANVHVMDKGAADQASQIQNISDFSKDLATTIEETNTNAQKAAEAASEADKIATHGSVNIQKSMDGMREIYREVNNAAHHVRILNDLSEKIGDISSFIGDVAKNTNLLALNASLEAARAGQSGSGFSVVASEIRKLAGRTSDSAEEISGIINEVQNSIENSRQAISNGMVQVNEGQKLADEAGEALRQIVNSVKISTESSMEISEATQKQTEYSQKIVENLEHIATIATNTAHKADQSSQLAKKLADLSQTLDNTVQKFHLA